MAAPPVPPPAPPAPSPAPMLGVVPTSAGPSRSRIRTEFDRVNKETFVENMLRQTANALASDAEFGNNSANKIRDRVEDLADEMAEEDPVTGLPQKSAGRAVVEARFALGGDNGQYMSQAVAMLWAGDGGERLRIVPPTMMPQIMRHASAEGIIRAMRSVMVASQAQSTTMINTGLELAGWMMQVDEIRNGVLDYLRQTGLDEVVGAADTITARYAAGAGMEWVMNVLKHSEDIAANYTIAKAIVEAVYALSDVGSYPMQVVNRLLDASQAVVKKSYDDTALVALLGQLIGKEIQDWQSFDPALTDPIAGFCPEYDANGLRTPGLDGGQPRQREFQTAVSAACSRIGATHKVKYFDVAAGNVAVNDVDPGAPGWQKWDTGNPALPAGKEWYLERVLTPLWNQDDRVYAYTPTNRGAFYSSLGDGAIPGGLADVRSANRTLDGLMRMEFQLVKTAGAARAIEMRGLPRSTPAVLSTQSSDPWMIDFCILRGLCGYQGPHQTLPLTEAERLPYNYPTTEMRSYYSAGLYSSPARIPEITLGAEARAEIAAVMNLNYASVERRVDQRTNAVIDGIELDTDYFGYAWRESRDANGIEAAKEVSWAPIKTDTAARQGAAAAAAADENNDVDYSPTSLNVCEASMYEMMAKALIKRATAIRTAVGAAGPPVAEAQIRTLRAGAAAAKIRQLQCMAYIASDAGDAMQWQGMIKKPANTLPERMVTRPSQQCARPQHKDVVEKLLIPVDAGIARFVHSPGVPAPAAGPAMPARTPVGAADTYVKLNDDSDGLVQCEKLSSWLRRGAEKGWQENTPPLAPTEVQGLPDRFGLRLGLSADTQPFAAAPATLGEWTPAMEQFGWLAPADLTFENIHKVAAHAVKASIEVLQLMQEEQYIARLETDGSPERQGVFGLNTDKTVEDASRSRRADVWSDAMREVAVSGDRLYRFVTALTGAIGESADSAISWEDEDLKQLAKDAATRQKALSERVSRFQTKLVESVVSSTLKGSKLQLDMRGKTADDQQLVVLSADVKDSIRQITDGEAGHGFFEASVEINEALGRSARPMTIHEIVANLQNVSQAFHNQVATSMAPSSGASYSRITEPRNSFMLHLKPDTLAAIQKAYDFIVSEMRHCGGYHRSIHLWEFVEGKDWVMCTRFAELVGLMLQNTRMRSGSFAAYVGTPQLIANGHNIRMQIQRLRTQVCHYLHTQMDMPMWLFPDGRTYYFGGTPKRNITAAMANRDVKRQKTYDAGADFGGDEGDDRFDRPDKVARAPRPQIIRRDVLNRMLQVARVRRNEMRTAIMEGRPGPLQGYSLKGMLDYLDDPKKFVSEFGATRGDSMRMSVAHMAQQISSQSAEQMQLQWRALLQTAAATATAPGRETLVCGHIYKNSSDRAVGMSFCEQLLDTAYKSVVNGRPYTVSNDGLYLQQPVELNEVKTFRIGGVKTVCHVVRVDITGRGSATKPPVAWQRLSGTDHRRNQWVKDTVDLELNTIFMMDVTSRQKWRPHPDFTSLDDADGKKGQNVWIKPYDINDLKLATAGRRGWWYVRHLRHMHRLKTVTAMTMVGGALVSGYLGSPELSSAREAAWSSSGLDYASTLGGQTVRAYNPFGNGVPGQGGLDFTSWDGVTNIDTQLRRQLLTNQMDDMFGLGAGIVGHYERLRNQVNGLFMGAWNETKFAKDTLSPERQQAQSAMLQTDVEVMLNQTRMRRSAAQIVVDTLSFPVGLRPPRPGPAVPSDPAADARELQNAREVIAECDKRLEFWRPVVESGYAREAFTPEHEATILDPVLSADSAFPAWCAAEEILIAAPRDKEFDGCRDFFNGSLKCVESVMGEAFDAFFKQYFTFGEGESKEKMVAALNAMLKVASEADKVGISAHLLYKQDIPTELKKLVIASLEMESLMIKDGSKYNQLRPEKDRLKERIAFYQEFGGMLSAARGDTEEYQAKVTQAIREAYETPLKEAGGVSYDSTTWGAAVKYITLGMNRLSGNSRAVHEVNYQSQTQAAQSLMEMKEDQRVAAAQRSALSYAFVKDAWNNAATGENFPAWVRGPGREVVLEQLRRLSKYNADDSAREKRILDKMAEMSIQEKSEDSFGVFVAFVAELVKESFQAGKLDKLGDLFPLGEAGSRGSRAAASEVLMNECGTIWDGRFPLPRSQEESDQGVCPVAWSYADWKAAKDATSGGPSTSDAPPPPPPGTPPSPSAPPPGAEEGDTCEEMSGWPGGARMCDE